MSFPRYEKYKDSGVEWLGEVPGHWVPARLSRVVAAIKDGTHGTFKRTVEGRPLLSAKNVAIGSIDVSDAESLISEADYAAIVANGFPVRGDLLLTIVGTIGRSCVYAFDEPMAFQRSVCFIRLEAGHSPSFFFYLTQSKFFQEQLQSRSKSAAQSGVYMGDVVATSVVFPPSPAEQIAIATFLEYETAKIDALVEEQKRLIELLKEKRQAVTSHAVTKGLNPNAPMKDSGVEWLGEVPAHWTHPTKLLSVAARRKNSFVNGPFGSDLLTNELQDHGVPVIYIRDLNEAGYCRVSEVCVSEEKADELAFCNVIAGDVLVAKVGDPPGLAVVYPAIEPKGIVTQDVIRLRLDAVLAEPRFMAHLLNSDFGKLLVDGISVESTRTRIGLGEYKQLRVVLPPATEQAEIANALAVWLHELAELRFEAERAVELLQERRTALISAAVTGKIDVRGAVDQPALEAP